MAKIEIPLKKDYAGAFKYWVDTNTENGVCTIPEYICKGIVGMLGKQPVVTDTNVGDTISRQAAKEAHCKHFCHLYCYRDTLCSDNLCKEVNEVFDKLPPAQPEAKKDWLYDYLVGRLGKSIVDNKEEFHKWFERMVWHVKRCDELSEERRSRQWIPVSEKLPEERDWYLGIFKEPDTGWINPIPFICDYLLGTKTKATTKEGWILKGHTDREEYIDYYFNLECVAWMPLPEPYKEGDNMNADGTLDQEEMHKALKLNPYLRDVCGVPFRDSLGLAMLIVANWDGIKSRVEGQEVKE